MSLHALGPKLNDACYMTAPVHSTARCNRLQSIQDHVVVVVVQAIDKYDSKYAGEGPHDSHVTIPDPASIW